VAIEAADITLISGSLAGVVTAIRLSRATMRNIRQNLFFALIYNALGIPVAAGALYPLLGIRLSPMLAAVAMAASSLSVVTNSSRLRRWQPPPLPAGEPASVVEPPVEPHVETPVKTPATAADHHHGGSAGHHDGGSQPEVDPVCGMPVAPATAAAHRSIDKTTVYFCSAGCAATFDTDPRRYLPHTATGRP